MGIGEVMKREFQAARTMFGYDVDDMQQAEQPIELKRWSEGPSDLFEAQFDALPEDHPFRTVQIEHNLTGIQNCNMAVHLANGQSFYRLENGGRYGGSHFWSNTAEASGQHAVTSGMKKNLNYVREAFSEYYGEDGAFCAQRDAYNQKLDSPAPQTQDTPVV